jgi:hypothetical protein
MLTVFYGYQLLLLRLFDGGQELELNRLMCIWMLMYSEFVTVKLHSQEYCMLSCTLMAEFGRPWAL